MEQRYRDKRGRIIPKIGVNKWGNEYWKNGVSYQNWKYIHPASVRVFAEGWGITLNRLPTPAKEQLKQLYEQDIDSQTALKTVLTTHNIPVKALPSKVAVSPPAQSPSAVNVKEFYLEYHDSAANSHKWYAGLGVGDKYVTAHGRIAGFGRASSISVSNVSHAAMGWSKLSSVEKRKLKSGYKPAGNPLNAIPKHYRDVMATKLGAKIPAPAPATPVFGGLGSTPSKPAPPKSSTPVFGMVSSTPPPVAPTPAPLTSPITAMTALSFDKHGSKIDFPAIVQRKLDGVRCLAWTDSNGDVMLMSRRNNPFYDLDHIRTEIKSLNLPPNIVLDGELYAHGDKMTFQKLAGLVRRHKVSGEDAKEVKKIRYHVYDMVDLNDRMKPFTDRHKFLVDTIGKSKPQYLDVVENFTVGNVSEADKLHSKFVQEGYEGLMFRNMSSPYQGKRSAHLQKYKKFDDSEFEVIGYEEAQGKDAGTVIWILETPTGEQFRARPKGTLAERARMFNEVSRKPETYIGKMMTIKYFGLTDAGIPRFPIAIALRNYE